MTILTLGFKIHAREGPEHVANNHAEEIKMTDQLTIQFGYNSEHDIYYMSTVCAAHLLSNYMDGSGVWVSSTLLASHTS